MMTLWQVPVVVAALLTWLSAPPATLADAAEREAVRRVLIGRATTLYTNLDVPESAYDGTIVAMGEPETMRRGAPASPDAVPAGDQESWRARAASIRDAISRFDLLASAVKARIGELTEAIVERTDPTELRDQLQVALAELDRLQSSALNAREALEALHTEAIRTGTPLEWLR
jgi:hypothetical protein